MEEYSWGTKYIVDSLASIQTPISNIDLVQLTSNELDEDYHTLVTALSYGANLLTFEPLFQVDSLWVAIEVS